MKKYPMILAGTLGMMLIFSGCSSKSGEGEHLDIRVQKEQETEAQKEIGEDAADTTKLEGMEFPETYEKESENVIFQCEVEVPEEVRTAPVYQVSVQKKYPDAEQVMKEYIEGKDIQNEEYYPSEDGSPEYYVYELADGSRINIDTGFSYGSALYSYYSNAGFSNEETYVEGELSFASGEQAVKEIEKMLDQAGFSEQDFLFSWQALSGEAIGQKEEEMVQLGEIQPENGKGSWSQEDDAYLVWAYQKFQGLPVFHEYMSMSSSWAYDISSNAPVVGIYSKRGVESCIEMALYDFVKSEEVVLLKPFEEIAAVVEEKYNSLLSDSQYTVTRAKLYERVYENEQQNLVAEPFWYFETLDNEGTKLVTLINAQTGLEGKMMYGY